MRIANQEQRMDVSTESPCPGGCGGTLDDCECWLVEQEQADYARIGQILERRAGDWQQVDVTYFDVGCLIEARGPDGRTARVFHEDATDLAYEVVGPTGGEYWETARDIYDGVAELEPWA